ncbi:Putative carboxylesterase, type B, carboxylesterase type B, active, alpha/Beta hydrolase [Colletotrichum destructivum]|uniref:Carboxylic ester hydrolase n=1 Tax=Colletotrichum destructivum TaxID=34406 RepID=A0AAX4IET1_9PEZI|nr:Putative carboxylesterase, type B, carboxylesterase type B, active, alpha/Beta hydrolase [Colletotrichum destructivum]
MSPPVSSPVRDQRPTVRLNQGTYIGATLAEPTFPRSVDAFLGVPYATCQRLRRAELPGASRDTFDASDYGPACPTADPSFPSDENCLNANIFRSVTAGHEDDVQQSGAKREKVPVLVYCHGGAFNFGRGGDRNLAAFVAFAKRDLVAVSFNYRLGPLGFLPCGLAAAEGIANLGLLDQRMLLQWVQRNIAAFGGDEKDVTVMGFSAGAHSLGHHLLSPSSRALFRRAILESGAPTARSVLSSAHPRHEAQFTQFLACASLSGVSPPEILPALRALPLRTLLHASLATWTECAPSVQWPFQPSVDGDATEDGIIPIPPIEAWGSPSLPPPPPLITGFNTSEGTMFVPAAASSPTALADFFSVLIPALTPRDLELLESLYPPASTYPPPPTPAHGPQFRRLAQAYGHYGYIAPLLHSAHLASLAGAPVWVYEYAAHADLAAANHGDHVPAATHDTDVLSAHTTPGLLAVSDAMHGYWSSFATAGAAAAANNDDNGDADGPNALPNTSGVAWPRFVTPFGDAGDSALPSSGPQSADETPRGRILVFGEGNDELMGGRGERRRGAVARVRTLTGLELRQFRFWWDRVGLSEGNGSC